MKKQRKHCAPEEKVAILRRHLLEQVPISELCDKHGLQPTVFYRWQKEFFENGTAAFQPKGRPNHSGGGTFRRRVEQYAKSGSAIRIMAGVKARR
jgi:transposase